jgi:hypothetical protein
MDKYRYIEVCSKDAKNWRAVVPMEPMSVHAAEAEAVSNAAEHWGVPIDQVDVFVTRTVTKEKHAKLVEAMKKGTLNSNWWLAGRGKVEG